MRAFFESMMTKKDDLTAQAYRLNSENFGRQTIPTMTQVMMENITGSTPPDVNRRLLIASLTTGSCAMVGYSNSSRDEVKHLYALSGMCSLAAASSSSIGLISQSNGLTCSRISCLDEYLALGMLCAGISCNIINSEKAGRFELAQKERVKRRELYQNSRLKETNLAFIFGRKPFLNKNSIRIAVGFISGKKFIRLIMLCHGVYTYKHWIPIISKSIRQYSLICSNYLRKLEQKQKTRKLVKDIYMILHLFLLRNVEGYAEIYIKAYVEAYMKKMKRNQRITRNTLFQSC